MVRVNMAGPVPGSGSVFSTTTDAEGRWNIADAPPGDYLFEASKAGYITTAYGHRRPSGPGKVVKVTAGAAIGSLDVRLQPGGVITGRVSDEFGEPISAVLVMPLRPRYIAGERQLLPALGNEMMAMAQGGVTDDLGTFRIHGLAAGTYYVSAQVGGAFYPGGATQQTGYVQTYYPGTASIASATRVTVEAGGEVNATFPLTRTTVVTVSGSVIDASGRPATQGSVWLTPEGATASRGDNIRPDGTFVFKGVPPGEYVVRAQTNTGRGRVGGAAQLPSEFGWAHTTVSNADVAQVAVQTSVGATAAGRVAIDDGSTVGASLTGPFWVRAVDTMPSAARFQFYGNQARVQPDGTFQLSGLLGRQFMRIATPGAPGTLPLIGLGTLRPSVTWFLKSVTIGGVDVTDSGYEFGAENVSGIHVVISRQAAVLKASVADDRAEPIMDYSLIAFSTDQRQWDAASRFVLAADSGDDGTAEIKGLPAGEYFVIAVPLIEPGQETDQEQLGAWRPRATRVVLGDAETKQVQLRLIAP